MLLGKIECITALFRSDCEKNGMVDPLNSLIYTSCPTNVSLIKGYLVRKNTIQIIFTLRRHVWGRIWF